MTFQQILNDLHKKIYKPIYFLMGDEPYFIDKITEFIQENVLNEAEKSFNQTILYGKDSTIEMVINSAKRYPMMSNQQVVIVKEAQNLNNIDDLIYYAEHPLNSTILVINYKYKKLDKRKKLYKLIEKAGVLFDSAKLYEDKVPNWITTYLQEKGYTIDPKASLLLTEFLGNDLNKISNELDKLIITIPGNDKKISNDHIEKNIGISKDYNNFELNNALSGKDVLKANRIIKYFEKNPKDNPIVLTISMLYMHFNRILLYHFLKDKSRQGVAAALKINPYFIKDYEKAARNYSPKKVVEIISLLREYDLKSKGFGNVSSQQGELLKELVFKILH